MILEFVPSAMQTYNCLKKNDPTAAVRIKSLIRDILEHPETGMGSPTRLSGHLSSKWMRNISFNEFLLYSFSDTAVKILHIQTAYKENSAARNDFVLEGFSKDEEKAVMDLMSANRGRDSEPKVGIFWYNRANNSLFGVVSHRLSDYTKANASGGRITCSEMHEDVWKKEFHKQKYQNGGIGPFIGAYENKPRGRVFYNTDGTFEVAVGKWIEEYPDAYALILAEFNLPADRTHVKYAIHWDIGQTWR